MNPILGYYFDSAIYCADCFDGDTQGEGVFPLYCSDECDYQRTCERCHEPIDCQRLMYQYEVFQVTSSGDIENGWEIADTCDTGKDITVKMHDKEADILKSLDFKETFESFGFVVNRATIAGGFGDEEITVICTTTEEPALLLKRID
jgi:hypothetical protein